MTRPGKHPLRLHWLDPNQPNEAFPPVARALVEPNGLLAVGGCLRTQRLRNAYFNGIFPWFNEDEPILWWSPSPRCVFVPGTVHVAKSLTKSIRKNGFRLTIDQAFTKVVMACAAPRRDGAGTWISDDIVSAYTALHAQGHAHSIEVWQGDALVGGLYGVAIGGAFFGESMFSAVTDASKAALTTLSIQLERWGFALLDAQVENPHLMRMGAQLLARPEFEGLLAEARDLVTTATWVLDDDLARPA